MSSSEVIKCEELYANKRWDEPCSYVRIVWVEKIFENKRASDIFGGIYLSIFNESFFLEFLNIKDDL